MTENLNNIGMGEQQPTKLDSVIKEIEENPTALMERINSEIMRKEMILQNMEKEVKEGEKFIESLNDPALTQLMNKINSENPNMQEIGLEIEKIKKDSLDRIEQLLTKDQELLNTLSR